MTKLETKLTAENEKLRLALREAMNYILNDSSDLRQRASVLRICREGLREEEKNVAILGNV